MDEDAKKRKGVYGASRLTISSQYLYPSSRRPVLLAGLALTLALVAYAVFDLSVGEPVFLSNGPLSSSHSVITAGADGEKSCNACHVPLQPVRDEQCEQCHEQFGDPLGIYTFAAHSTYRSRNPERVASHDALPCASCHGEHRGREADLTAVADESCQGCHAFGSFADGHPPFEFERLALRDRAGLKFTHIAHVERLLDDADGAPLQSACLACHEPRPGGASFEPIAFDRHCWSCHLSSGDETGFLPIVDARSPRKVGVETLASIRRRGSPGTEWANRLSPSHFELDEGAVNKTSLQHADPWVLHNLRVLRTHLEEPGLAELVETGGTVPAREREELYGEALATLERHLEGLRGVADASFQDHLREIDARIAVLRDRVRNPHEETDPSLLAPVYKRVSQTLIDAVNDVGDQLTSACTQCHFVDRARIANVQKAQRQLYSAEFNHRVHVKVRGCLDCHDRIAFGNAGAAQEEDEARSAAVLNLPGIASCTTCHNAELASSRCITCHEYHPHKERRNDFSGLVGWSSPAFDPLEGGG